MSTRVPHVFLAHEDVAVCRVAAAVLGASGFSVETFSDGHTLAEALAAAGPAGAVLDVALPGRPGYELAPWIRKHRPDTVVILIASVYRRTSYKRRPERLYGAHDYVEMHHVCDHLPQRLWKHLAGDDRAADARGWKAARRGIDARGDGRLLDAAADPARIVELVVADAVLYAGDDFARARTAQQAQAVMADDLQGVADLLAEVGAFGGDRSRIDAEVRAAVESAWSRIRAEGTV